jgi:hypothetical protein
MIYENMSKIIEVEDKNNSSEKELNEDNDEENEEELDEEEDYDEEDDEEEDEEEDDEEEENEDDETEQNEEDNKEKEPLKKKRGRKSKPKEIIPDEEKIQKKRGRKPKVKDIEPIEKIPKKRGRKPKEKIYSVKELPKTFFEENKSETHILHLPIKMSDRENITEPKPNMNNNIHYSMLDSSDIGNNYINSMVNNDDMLLTQNNLIDNLVFDNEDYQKNENISDKNILRKEFDKKEFEKEDDETKPNKIIKKNLRNIMYEFINSNTDKSWPESTNTYCWWCCHPFSGSPCALPELYRKEKFYVSGCFCSFNCTASYNFSKNDDNMWERYSLLNLMYKKLYNQKFVKISLAPPREILKIFGGYMSIEEFRENSLRNEKIFTVIKPPLISIIPKIEENISTANKNVKNNILNVNENILNKTQNNLKLKRNKPITNPNSTLQSFMDLKII